MVEPRVVATATFIKQMDTLFDSFNGRTRNAPEGKELRCAVTEDSPHVRYWREAFSKISQLTFKRLTKGGTIKSSKPPSQVGWLTSLNAIQEVWYYMLNKGASSLRPRSLNQDPLENMFGGIRYACGCNDNPNSKQFIGSLKTNILNGLTNQAIASNCEEDDHILLTNFKSFLEGNTEIQTLETPTAETSSEINADDIVVEDLTNKISEDVSAGNHTIFSVAYVAGYIIKRIQIQINDCDLCNSQLTSDNLELHNIYITNKEWANSKNSLVYPCEAFTVLVGTGITNLEHFLNKNASQEKIMLNAQLFLKNNLSFDWLTCTVHKDLICKSTIKSVCKIGIPWWCKRTNQVIKEEKKEKRANKRKIKKFKH